MGDQDDSCLFDIILVNYNSTNYLLKCLDTVYDALGGRPAAIYIQDNHSQDCPEKILEQFPQIHLTLNDTNLGFAAAVNQAILKSTSPYIVLLNPDSLMVKGFFEAAIPYLSENPTVGIIGPRILDSDGSIQGSARSFPTPLTAFFGRKSLFTRLFPNNRITSANVLTSRCDGITPMEVDWVSGACMIVRRQAIDAVSLFDERFFMYWEDADWCRRMWNSGWKVVYFPLSEVMHYVGVSSDQLMIRSLFEFHKSVYLLFDKYNRPSPWLLKPLIVSGLFLRMVFVATSGCIHLWIGRVGTGRYVSQKPPVPAGFRRIRVLRMIARLNIGGPAIHVHLLTTGMNPQRFETLLVTGNISSQEGDMSYLFDSDENKPQVIPELQRDISPPLDIKAMIHIFQTLNRFKPDIVDTHTAKAGFSARFAVLVYNFLFRQHVHIVHTFHGHVFDGYFSRAKSGFFVWIERMIAKLTNVIIAISDTQRQELVEKYRIAPKEKVRTIELGFDLSPFLSCNDAKGRFRKNLGIDADTITVGIIGRLVPIKNHAMFLRTARLFLDTNPDIKIRFIIVGDGECRQELEKTCKAMRLSEQVIFWGWVRNIQEVYADLDILALTSLNEGTPFSIIEAMASSVPVIATLAGGVQDLLGYSNLPIPDKGFAVCNRGILCQKNDSTGFASGLKYLISEPEAIQQKRIQAAREFVSIRYSQKRLLQDIETLYLELMGQQQG
jgi:GT2 family glycosyltransferase